MLITSTIETFFDYYVTKARIPMPKTPQSFFLNLITNTQSRLLNTIFAKRLLPTTESRAKI